MRKCRNFDSRNRDDDYVVLSDISNFMSSFVKANLVGFLLTELFL